MRDDVDVSAWVRIDETSRIHYHLSYEGQVEFCVGDSDELVLDTDELGLQHFIAHAEQALRALRDANASDDEDCAPG
ncbi:MAG: hypothetical protein ACRDRI_01095 [Pseudonocardiaceae bacterium]